MKLYSYWRSTTSYRVRAALNLKRVEYEIIPVDLIAGDQVSEAYCKLNPGKGVPALVLDDGTVLTQSMAILDFVDTKWTTPKLSLKNSVDNARMMAIADTFGLDIHPLNNVRVVKHIKSMFDATDDQCEQWMIHWMREGFKAAEALVPSETGYSFGDTPTIADLCIVAQAYNAERYGLELHEFRKLDRIKNLCLQVPEIMAAHPANQPDAKV